MKKKIFRKILIILIIGLFMGLSETPNLYASRQNLCNDHSSYVDNASRGETTCCPLINSIESNTKKALIYGVYENYVISPDGEWINVTAKCLVCLPFTFGMKVPKILGPYNEYRGFITSKEDTPGRLIVIGINFMWCFGEVELW